MTATSMLVYIHDRQQYVGLHTENIGLYTWPLAVRWVYIHIKLVYIHDRQQYAGLHTWPPAVCWSTYLIAGTMNGITTSQFTHAALPNSQAWMLAGQFCNVTLWPGPRSRGRETVSSATSHLQNSDIPAAFCTVYQHYSYFPVWDTALY